MCCFPSTDLTVWQHMKEELSQLSESRCWETQMFPVLCIMGEPTPPASNHSADVAQLWFPIRDLAGSG